MRYQISKLASIISTAIIILACGSGTTKNAFKINKNIKKGYEVNIKYIKDKNLPVTKNILPDRVSGILKTDISQNSIPENININSNGENISLKSDRILSIERREIPTKYYVDKCIEQLRESLNANGVPNDVQGIIVNFYFYQLNSNKEIISYLKNNRNRTIEDVSFNFQKGFKEINLENYIFKNCCFNTVEDIYFTNLKLTEFNNCHYEGDFIIEKMESVKFNKCNILNIQLPRHTSKEIILDGTDVTSSQLSKCFFSNSKLSNMKVLNKGKKIEYMGLTNTKLENIDFGDGLKIYGLSCVASDFNRVNFRGSDFWWTTLGNKITNCDFSFCNFLNSIDDTNNEQDRINTIELDGSKSDEFNETCKFDKTKGDNFLEIKYGFFGGKIFLKDLKTNNKN